MTQDDFDRAWQETFAQFQPQIALTTALFKLTGLGDHPVEIEQLAAAIGRSPDETVALARQWARVRMEDGRISFDPESSPFSRYHVEIGARVIDVGGCAVDLFWAALASGVSFRAESRCPATGIDRRFAVRLSKRCPFSLVGLSTSQKRCVLSAP